ncbi:MAG TPA: tetratricopeptide repeat protein [Candidatus Hydrogenedentes bacterium]|nr:tetratricopeptide repeat protein [Candidatus Hydrogenedentota bacterium]
MNITWCKDHQEALCDAVEGTLPPALSAHVEHCPACRKALAEFKALHHELGTLDDFHVQNAPEVDLVDAVMQGVQEVKAGRRVLAPVEFADSIEMMAYLEGEMDPQACAMFEKRLQDSPQLQEEVSQLSALHAECQTLGMQEFHAMPEVELTAAVMSKLQSVQTAAPKIIPFRARPRVQAQPVSRPRFRWSWAPLAAAACLVVGAFFAASIYINGKVQSPSESQNTARVTPPDSEKEFTHTQSEATLAKRKKTKENIDTIRKRESRSEEVNTGQNPGKGISVQDAINARREALLGNKDARSRFEQWGSLTPEEARQLLQEPGLSSEAVAALCQYLPSEEAAEVLRNAAKEHPDDPYLKLALAQALVNNANGLAEGINTLNAMSEKDPDNSMPLFMEAKLRFANGDPEGALNALTKACGLQELDSYAQEAARAHEEALLLSGMDADTAHFLAGSSAGGNEYGTMTKLSQDLIAQGDKYAAAGDYDTAQQIYQGVQRLGSQLVTSAVYADEQLAGYDAQQQALDALEAIYVILQDSENLEALEAMYNGIAEGLDQLLQLIAGLDSIYGSGSDAVLDAMSSWLTFGNVIH